MTTIDKEYKPEDAAVLFPDERLSASTNLRNAQLVMLRILKVFDAICRKHKLNYWLDAGTLLGAARHDGFIPWDDDVDVMMPIEDYTTFCSIAEKELPYDLFFQTHETDPKHDITWAKIRDRFSYMDDPGGPYPYCQGIPIDIFPAYIQTKRQFSNRNITGLFPPFNNKPLKTSKRYSFKHNAYNFVVGCFQAVAKLFYSIPAFYKHFDKRMNSNAPDNVKGFVYNPERPWFYFFPCDVVFPLSEINFENYTFYAPKDVNQYLTIRYGDWRTPPPENKRVAHDTTGIHLTDAGPKPDAHSLKWEDYHK